MQSRDHCEPCRALAAFWFSLTPSIQINPITCQDSGCQTGFWGFSGGISACCVAEPTRLNCCSWWRGFFLAVRGFGCVFPPRLCFSPGAAMSAGISGRVFCLPTWVRMKWFNTHSGDGFPVGMAFLRGVWAEGATPAARRGSSGKG